MFENIKLPSGTQFTRLHSGGGGVQNETLSRANSNALGIEVEAGPVEATSCGNVITQMIGMQCLAALQAGRDLIRRSFDFRNNQPQDAAAWDAAHRRFTELLVNG